VAFAIIEEELGQPLERLFSKISSETIAAASLGQVYRATLRETGEDVAIKVPIFTLNLLSVYLFYYRYTYKHLVHDMQSVQRHKYQSILILILF